MGGAKWEGLQMERLLSLSSGAWRIEGQVMQYLQTCNTCKLLILAIFPHRIAYSVRSVS